MFWFSLLVAWATLVSSTYGYESPEAPDWRYVCPDDYQEIQASYQEIQAGPPLCFKVGNEKVTRYQAWSLCGHGNDLVPITTLKLQKFLVARLSKQHRYWIGIQRMGIDNPLLYDFTGEDLGDFQPWACGQPSNSKNDKLCVELVPIKEGRWKTRRCDMKRRYICIAEADPVT